MPRRTSRRAASALATLAVFVLLGLLYACQSLLGLDLGLTPGTPAPPTPIADSSGGESWYQLYFTDPAATAALDDPQGGIPAAIALSLGTAQRSIDAAVYEFDLRLISDALLAAAGRGVAVRLVTDTDSLGEEPVQALLAAGVPVVDDGREAIMHDKFIVVDEAVVWTGSMNFTRNDAYRNNNNVLQIRSTRLAENYSAEFEEMFSGRAFGPTSPANTPNPSLNLSGTLIQNYFSPDDGVAAHILEVLSGARSSIRFMAFSFTRQDFAEALIEKAEAGVAVQGVFETRQVAAGADQAWTLLSAAGLDVRQDGNRYNLHSKVFIVDEQIVVTGSYNFSRNAEQSNDENVLIIHNPEIAAAYLEEWRKVWEEAE